jgi:hypothetical protein
VGQQLLQTFEIAVLDGCEEAGRELLALLTRGLEPGAALVDVRRARVASWRAFCSLVPMICAIRL